MNESTTTRKAPPTYDSVMARLAERKAAKAQASAASKPTAPSPSRQPPSRRTPSTTSTVSSRSTQRVSSNTSTVSSTSIQRNREMSPVTWQPLLPKIKAATPLPAPQPVKPATPSPAPAPQSIKVFDKWTRQSWQEPMPVFKHTYATKFKEPTKWSRDEPDNQRIPKKSCLKSGPQSNKSKKSVQFKATGICVVVPRYINPEDQYEDLEKTNLGKLRRFGKEFYIMGNQHDGTNTHDYCDCTMNVLQLTPEKHLPFYADTILADCRRMNLSTAGSARMCSTFDGTGITD
ncbi:hypothetical protein MMC18_006723 [Xylographa bjoerkii]|nr:hypothetical protein [Xylographa bjoerkii]